MVDDPQQQDFDGAITSFDWNPQNSSYLASASLDSTCTVWNIETQQVSTQLIAHENHAVYDISYENDQGRFATAGEDGTIRLFDLRDLNHSTIIYEANKPLIRVAQNKLRPNELAVLEEGGSKVVLIDKRKPYVTVGDLKQNDEEDEQVNAIAWHPHNGTDICTAGNRGRALIWNLDEKEEGQPGQSNTPEYMPAFSYEAGVSIKNMQWSEAKDSWVSICFENNLQTLRFCQEAEPTHQQQLQE